MISKLKEVRYRKYFLIAWLFSYVLIHFGTNIEYSGNLILRYQPATAIILALTYAYTEMLYFGYQRAKGEKNIKDSAINAIKCAIKVTIYLWFLWGDSPI